MNYSIFSISLSSFLTNKTNAVSPRQSKRARPILRGKQTHEETILNPPSSTTTGGTTTQGTILSHEGVNGRLF